MPTSSFDDMDQAQLQGRGISVEEIQRQLYLFQTGSAYSDLVRPCTPGDGIESLDEPALLELSAVHDRAAREGRITKFVPASGAATRMFRDLFHYFLLDVDRLPPWKQLESEAETGVPQAVELTRFLGELDHLGFYEALRDLLADRGMDIDTLRGSDSYPEILETLLAPEGLGYSDLPKGLIPFHRYEEGSRTSFEEHLVESVAYVQDGQGTCRLHFTVSPEHLESFGKNLREIGTRCAERYGVSFEVTFSVQSAATDTLAVDLDNRPFRTERGRLLFRPGGHGSLLENLNELAGDIVFIKNIDNVQPDRVKETVCLWKRALGGYLVRLQDSVFDLLAKLQAGSPEEILMEEAMAFARDRLHILPPERKAAATLHDRRDYLLDRLNRPLRVCGVVENTGEPGGGPFWVRDRRGEVSLQIVETSQIDPGSEEQRQILASATHFNPVDLVCGVRDREGNPFDLRKYIDPDAVIITRKSSGGRDLKALERPGLWNGAMAGWTTVFVEVPLATFSPVKTVNDLLRPEHR